MPIVFRNPFQYSAYNFMAQNLSGEQTLGENIADNGGLKASYYAYRQWLKEQDFDDEPPLPGLNMTHNQLFFLSFAQVSSGSGCEVCSSPAMIVKQRQMNILGWGDLA